MLNGILRNLRLDTLILFVTTVSMLTCYVLFPIWKLVDNFFLSVVFAVSAGMVIPFLIRWLVGSILQGYRPKIGLGPLAMKHKAGFFYFGITSVGYLLILGPLVMAPLVPKGDEPFHVFRLVSMTWILTLAGRINPLLAGLFIIMGACILLVLVLVFSSEAVEVSLLRRISVFVSTRAGKLLIWGIIAAGCVGFVSIFSSWTITTGSLSRFGPLHPLLLFLPHLLLGFSDLTVIIWKILNLMLMVGAATISGKITHDLLSEIDKGSCLGSKTRHALSALAGWLFLSFPATVALSTELYLTSGVAIFFMLNCYFLLKILSSHNQTSETLYIILLSLGLGLGSLWKRVLLVQAGACFVMLLIVFMLRSDSRKADKLLLWLKAITIYSLLFGPWLVIIQFQGLVGRPYILNTTYLLLPYILDYYYRFESQMGLFLGVLGYVSLLATLSMAMFRRSSAPLALSAQYGVWYLFFALDDGWSHTVDRFFVPVLPIMAVSSVLLLASILLLFRPVFQKTKQTLLGTQHDSEAVTKPRKVSYMSVVLLAIVILSTFNGTHQNFVAASMKIDNSIDHRYVPYDEAAKFIHSVINGNSSKLWSRWGPSSLSFYLNKYGKYTLTPSGYGERWQPDPHNETAEAFVAFLNENGYSVLALPTQGITAATYVPPLVIEQLILRYEELGFNDMIVYSYGSNRFYIWTM